MRRKKKNNNAFILEQTVNGLKGNSHIHSFHPFIRKKDTKASMKSAFSVLAEKKIFF